MVVKKLDYIDCLRGVAILMVILVHVSQSISTLNPLIKAFCDYGQMGVILFFCLSAITICISLQRGGTNKMNIYNFYIRRFFRIAPLYYFGILIYGIYSYVLFIIFGYNYLETDYSLTNILANVFFVHGFYAPANNNVVLGGWSIGTEMAFYLLVPFVYIFFEKIKLVINVTLVPLVIFICTVIFFLLARKFFHFKTTNNSFWYFNLINHLPVFITSIAYYFSYYKMIINYSNKKKILLFILFIGTLLFNLWYFTNYFFITTVPFFSCISFLILITLFKETQLFNNKYLIKIGQLSYSMYIFHFLFAIQFSRFLNEKVFYQIFNSNLILLINYLIVVLLTFFLALFSQKYIEAKGIKWGKLFLLNNGN